MIDTVYKSTTAAASRIYVDESIKAGQMLPHSEVTLKRKYISAIYRYNCAYLCPTVHSLCECGTFIYRKPA
jgi:hypothetical protein